MSSYFYKETVNMGIDDAANNIIFAVIQIIRLAEEAESGHQL